MVNRKGDGDGWNFPSFLKGLSLRQGNTRTQQCLRHTSPQGQFALQKICRVREANGYGNHPPHLRVLGDVAPRY